MSKIRVTASRVINAAPKEIYDILVDYKVTHPMILPEEYLKELRVEAGGRGEGTVISFRLRAGGVERAYRMRVSEPEPGKVLVEKDIASSLETHFIVTPEQAGMRTRVEITTEWEPASGLAGFVEKVFTPTIMRRIYNKELLQLAETATDSSAIRPAVVSRSK